MYYIYINTNRSLLLSLVPSLLIGTLGYRSLDAYLADRSVEAMMVMLMAAEVGSVMANRNIIHLTTTTTTTLSGRSWWVAGNRITIHASVLSDHSTNQTIAFSTSLLHAIHVRHLTMLAMVWFGGRGMGAEVEEAKVVEEEEEHEGEDK